jgi:hypothetical protein
VRLCKFELYDISISLKSQKRTLAKHFGLTAKFFFCFSRADLNVITYEKQDIQQTRTKAFTQKSVSALFLPNTKGRARI